MVMLLGQYSTGKTTFIKHLLRTSYPGIYNSPRLQAFVFPSLFWSTLLFNIFYVIGAHIGPEPTTDRFVVVMVCSCRPFPF